MKRPFLSRLCLGFLIFAAGGLAVVLLLAGICLYAPEPPKFMFGRTTGLADEENAAFYLEKARKSLLEQDSEEAWDNLRRKLEEMLENETASVPQISGERRTQFWNCLEMVTNCKGCEWNIDYRNSFNSTLPGIDRADLFARLAFQKSRDLIQGQDFRGSLRYWKIGMSISRWIMYEKTCVTLGMGFRLEAQGLRLAGSLREHFPENFEDVREAYQKIPPRPPFEEWFEKDKNLYLYSMKYRQDILFDYLNDDAPHPEQFPRISALLRQARARIYFWGVDQAKVREALDEWYSFAHMLKEKVEPQQAFFLEALKEKALNEKTQKVILMGLPPYQEILKKYWQNQTFEDALWEKRK